MSLTWCMIVLAVAIGHFGLNLAIYNRINAFGLPRGNIKKIELCFFIFTVMLPVVVLVAFPEMLWDLVQGRPNGVAIPLPLAVYGWLCLAAWIFLGIPWLLWRPIFGLEWIRAPRKVEVVDLETALQSQLALSNICRFEARLPLNQIFELSIEEIELPVVGLPGELDGYRIAQISDLHLTGHVHPEFTQYAVERASQWQPDMMALTGDIIDKQDCIEWLDDIFSGARASDGCYYVLGNHDTRIVDARETRAAMNRSGWTDLGGRSLRCELRGVSTMLIGNEHPWFERPIIDPAPQGDFRLLLSHSPDQFTWARRHNVALMLAGHTHGGQGRLPLAGPLLSPSLHGSRYSSGDFFRPPTTMHVTRGLSGTHLMRINCRPEVSLITLRQPQSVDGRT